MIAICIGAKLAVAPVARATPLFLPRPEIIYINVVHYSAPPRTYLLRATPLFRPLWRHCIYLYFVYRTLKPRYSKQVSQTLFVHYIYRTIHYIKCNSQWRQSGLKRGVARST